MQLHSEHIVSREELKPDEIINAFFIHARHTSRTMLFPDCFGIKYELLSASVFCCQGLLGPGGLFGYGSVGDVSVSVNDGDSKKLELLYEDLTSTIDVAENGRVASLYAWRCQAEEELSILIFATGTFDREPLVTI